MVFTHLMLAGAHAPDADSEAVGQAGDIAPLPLRPRPTCTCADLALWVPRPWKSRVTPKVHAGESSPLIANVISRHDLDVRPSKDTLQVDANVEGTAEAGPSGQCGPLVEEMGRCDNAPVL